MARNDADDDRELENERDDADDRELENERDDDDVSDDDDDVSDDDEGDDDDDDDDADEEDMDVPAGVIPSAARPAVNTDLKDVLRAAPPARKRPRRHDELSFEEKLERMEPAARTKRVTGMRGTTTTPQGKVKTVHDGVPINELSARLNEFGPDARFMVKVQRRAETTGHLQTFPKLELTIPEIIDMETRLESLAGGGWYLIEVRNPIDLTQLVVPKFECRVFGPPRPPRHAGTVADANYQAAAAGPVPPGFPPPWVQGLPPAQQAAYVAASNPQGVPVQPHFTPGTATIASDRLALHQAQQREADVARLTAKLESLQEKYEDRIAQLEKELEQQRAIAREAQHRSEMAALNAKLEALSTARQEPRDSGPESIVKALAPFVPVFTAMVTARESSASKSVEVASANLQTMMQATLTQANKPSELERMFPIILPLLKEMMLARKPNAKEDAEMLRALSEQHLNSFAMMAQLIEAMNTNENGEQPWWQEVVKSGLENVKSVAAAYMEHVSAQHAPQPQALPAQAMALPRRPMAQPQPQPQPQQPQPQPQASARHAAIPLEYSSVEAAPEIVDGPPPNAVPQPQPQPQVQAQPSATALTGREKLLLSALPAEFRTPEWQRIVIELHRPNDIEALAALITSHLEHCIEFAILPPQLADLQTDPASALARIIGPLPFAQQHPERVQSLLELVISQLAEDGMLADSGPIAEPIDDGDESAGVPPQAATG